MPEINEALETVQELTGNKAILEIDCNNSSRAGKLKEKDNSKTVISMAASKLNNKISDVKEVFAPKAQGIGNGVIKVQYNPASIKYTGTTENKMSSEKDANNAGNQIVTITNSSTVNMSFTLIFHSKYPTDQSVREQMELILNMICNSPTRKIKFSWNNMQMEGKLVSFSGQYDMFDMTGNPISGQMNMTIKIEIVNKQIREILQQIDKERNDKTVDSQGIDKRV